MSVRSTFNLLIQRPYWYRSGMLWLVFQTDFCTLYRIALGAYNLYAVVFSMHENVLLFSKAFFFHQAKKKVQLWLCLETWVFLFCMAAKEKITCLELRHFSFVCGRYSALPKSVECTWCTRVQSLCVNRCYFLYLWLMKVGRDLLCFWKVRFINILCVAIHTSRLFFCMCTHLGIAM